MPIVTLKFKDRNVAEYRIDAGKSLTIGRKAENDVVIDSLAVSGHHAKIDLVGESYYLTDLQSTNGSFVNEIKISSHPLAHGDIISIGKHTLVFAYADDENRPDAPEEEMNQTMVMDTNMHRAMLKKSETQRTAVQDKMATMVILAGGKGEIGISKKLFKIGKDPSSDYQVGGFLVGQTAATISQRPDGYYLSYVEGLAKPKVNGKPVKDTVLLNEFDKVEIGKVKMQLVFKLKTSKK